MGDSYRRRITFYLLAIVGPTLVLLYLGLLSVYRQREAFQGLTVTNLRLSAERLASDVEHQVTALAQASLNDSELASLSLNSTSTQSFEWVLIARRVFGRISRRHPIVEGFFVFDGDSVRFPMAHDLPETTLDAMLSPQPDQAGRRFAQLVRDGEALELVDQRPDLALVRYRSSLDLNVPDRARALALSRVARCQRKINDLAGAADTYRTLVAKYGDTYDLFHRPHALVASLELGEVAGREDLAEVI